MTERARWHGWVLAMACAGAAACGTEEAAQTSSVQATEVILGDLRITAEATGTVEPIRKVEVKSKASGEILALAVDVGDQVDTGALLARIDPRDVRNTFEQAQADLEVAQARFEISQAQANRSKELVDAGVITAREYENSRLDLANSQAALVKAQTNLELAEAQLSDVTIRAPLAGTIISKNVEEGQVIQSASQNVSGGTTLFMMANLLEMQVRTLVDETDMGQIRAGMSAVVQVEAFADRTFRGHVEKIEPQAVVEQNVTMFPVIVRLDNRGGMLRPGMNAEVEVLVDEATDILLVPNNAIVLPRDVAAAASVLGLDPQSMDLAALGAGARGGGERREAGREAGGGGPGPATDSLRARMMQGGVNPDSMRMVMRGRRTGVGDGAAVFQGRGGVLQASAASPERQVRRAVVFVIDQRGTPTPRPVQIGLNDYDRTEVVSGLEQGDQVALLGAAQLQAGQQEFLDRIRQGRGGGMFGGGAVVRGR